MSVRFTMSAAARDVLQATTGANVALIKSIAAQHLSEVEGLVMRSVTEGRNLGYLATQIEARYGLTKRRAGLVARDQNNKATATLQRVRQQGLGITHAVWVHSRAGAHPRPEHVAFSGQQYEIDKGAFLEGEWVWPGTAINCRCVCRPVLPF
jgi:SPP1 gp7 family putative phage head morphogenesis protein